MTTPFQALLEAAPDAMLIFGPDGVIVNVNCGTERLFGRTRAELLGTKIERLIPDLDPSQMRAMGAGGPGGLAFFGRRGDGTEFPAEISLSPLDTEDGTLAIIAIRDVSERKRAEEGRAKLIQVEEAVRLRDEFLFVASHELKTPLTAALMQAESILRAASSGTDGPVAERLVKRVGSIHRAVHRLNKLVSQLLDLSRITAGRLTLEREEVDLAASVAGVVALFEDELSRAGSALVLDASAPVIGSWDAFRVEQIITNLLSNAIKYGEGKPIEVAVAEVDGVARLTVRDHGIGIAPEHQTRIFERFERILSERNYGGFGLGLWIVRQIIEAHEGTIRVSSEPSVGTVFTVDLPGAS